MIEVLIKGLFLKETNVFCKLWMKNAYLLLVVDWLGFSMIDAGSDRDLL